LPEVDFDTATDTTQQRFDDLDAKHVPARVVARSGRAANGSRALPIDMGTRGAHGSARQSPPTTYEDRASNSSRLHASVSRVSTGGHISVPQRITVEPVRPDAAAECPTRCKYEYKTPLVTDVRADGVAGATNAGARQAQSCKVRIRSGHQEIHEHIGIGSSVASGDRVIRIAPSTARASIANAMSAGAVASPVAGMFAHPPTVPSPKPPRSSKGIGSEVVRPKRDARSTVSSKKWRHGLSRCTDSPTSARKCSYTEATRKRGAAELPCTNAAPLQLSVKHRRIDMRALAEPPHRKAAAPDQGGADDDVATMGRGGI